MRAMAMTFSAGLLTGGAAIFIFLGQATEEQSAPEPPSDAPPAGSGAPAPEAPVESDAAPSIEAQLEQAMAEITALKAQLDSMRVEMEAKDGAYARLENELTTLKEQLAEEREARGALEQELATGSEPAGETQESNAPTAVDDVAVPPENAPGEAVAVADAPVAPVGAPEAPARLGEEFRGTGEFILRAGDVWLGDGSADVFKVLNVARADETQLARAKVDAFGDQGVVEQGAQVTRMMQSGLYTLIVMRIDAKAGIVELLVEREG